MKRNRKIEVPLFFGASSDFFEKARNLPRKQPMKTSLTYNYALSYTLSGRRGQGEVINANARLYDPVCARFLSPDNFVQSPANSTGFNRYAYCMNNPVVNIDPDGEIIFSALCLAFPIFAPLLPYAIQLDFTILGAWLGGTIATGDPGPWGKNTWKDENNRGWKGAVIGGMIGGMVGSGVASFAGVNGTGFMWQKGVGPIRGKPATRMFSSLFKGFNTASTNILFSALHGEDIDYTYKSAMIGFGSGFAGEFISYKYHWYNTSADASGTDYLGYHKAGFQNNPYYNPIIRGNIPRERIFSSNLISSTLNSYGLSFLKSYSSMDKNRFLSGIMHGTLSTALHLDFMMQTEFMTGIGKFNIGGNFLSSFLYTSSSNWLTYFLRARK